MEGVGSSLRKKHHAAAGFALLGRLAHEQRGGTFPLIQAILHDSGLEDLILDVGAAAAAVAMMQERWCRTAAGRSSQKLVEDNHETYLSIFPNTTLEDDPHPGLYAVLCSPEAAAATGGRKEALEGQARQTRTKHGNVVEE